MTAAAVGQDQVESTLWCGPNGHQEPTERTEAEVFFNLS
jgi:hypothetical protein